MVVQELTSASFSVDFSVCLLPTSLVARMDITWPLHLWCKRHHPESCPFRVWINMRGTQLVEHRSLVEERLQRGHRSLVVGEHLVVHHRSLEVGQHLDSLAA